MNTHYYLLGKLFDALEEYKKCIESYMELGSKAYPQPPSKKYKEGKQKHMEFLNHLMSEAEILNQEIKLRYASTNCSIAMDIEEKLINLKKDPNVDLNILRNSILHCIDCYNKSGDEFILNNKAELGQRLKQKSKSIAIENQHILDISKKDDSIQLNQMNNSLKRNLSVNSQSIINDFGHDNSERNPILILSSIKFAFEEKRITIEEKCILKEELIRGREFSKNVIKKLLPDEREAFIKFEVTSRLHLLDLKSDDQNSIALSKSPNFENCTIDSIRFERDLYKKHIVDIELEANKKEELIPSCPISLGKLEDPMVCCFCGNSFEKSFITEWLLNHSTCPSCRNHVTSDNYKHNLQLRNFIQSLKEKQF
jgi:hypothetical protein